MSITGGILFNPYRPSEVHWFSFDIEVFQLSPGQQATFWFSTPRHHGWSVEDYGHVSAMMHFDSPSEGPLEVVGEGVQRKTYTAADGSTYSSHLRLMTFRNPTNESLRFHCRAIQAPVRAESWGSQPTQPSPPTNEMNLLVLHDGQGRIIAAGEKALYQTNLAPCGIVPDEGQRAVEPEIPEEFSGLGLVQICENSVVDVEAERPTLKRKPE